MKITITQGPSKRHDDAHQQTPDQCACGGPIYSAYRKNGQIVCSICYYQKGSK
jgi:uncharacterized Zn finger protein (UPF0148 family)